MTFSLKLKINKEFIRNQQNEIVSLLRFACLVDKMKFVVWKCSLEYGECWKKDKWPVNETTYCVSVTQQWFVFMFDWNVFHTRHQRSFGRVLFHSLLRSFMSVRFMLESQFSCLIEVFSNKEVSVGSESANVIGVIITLRLYSYY